jgi:phosphoglycerate dehydrogenase-like enzyme
MKLLVTASLGKAQLQQRLAEKIGNQAHWVENAEAAISALPNTDALICPDHFLSAKVVDAVKSSAPKLRWIQLLTAGYDNIKRHGAPAHIAVCNAGEAYGPAVATHAIALLLALHRRIPAVLADQARHAWERGFAPLLTIPSLSTIVVIGFGPIGREIGRVSRALGARVIAVTRHGRPDAGADEVVAASELLRVLPRADAVMIAASYDESTHHLINARTLGLCKKSLILVNIARGAIVDTHTLNTALRNGSIAGAGLDVTDPEPLPPDNPLWDAPNLIITPHCSGACGPAAGDRLADLACDNLDRFMADTPLKHIVKV